MSIVRFHGALPELFPPDEESSVWMFRLAIIRHDLRFEIAQLATPGPNDRDESYRKSYFVRRISISLLEAESIMDYDLGKFLKRGPVKLPPPFVAGMNKVRKELAAARPTLEAVRHVVGAHVRPPDGSREDVAATKEMLRRHTGWTMDLDIDGRTGEFTDLRDVNLAAMFLAWPDVTDDTDLMAKHREYADAALAAAKHVMQAADALLYAYWTHLGIKPTAAP